MNQTKLQSLLEQTCNMGSGFIIAALAWAYGVAPAIRAGWLSVDDPIRITLIFTVISFIRGYFWRRFFNAGIHRLAVKFARGFYA